MWIKSLRHKCKKELCPTCGSSDHLKDRRPVEFISPVTNEEAAIPDVEFNICDDCGETWQTVEQFKTYQQKVVDSGHDPSSNESSQTKLIIRVDCNRN